MKPERKLIERDDNGKIVLTMKFPVMDYHAEQTIDAVNGTYTTMIFMSEEVAEKIWAAIGEEMVETAIVRMRTEPA